MPLPRTESLECTAQCGEPIAPTDVLVAADTAGCEGPAVDPYHLECYLLVADFSLPSNRPLLDLATGNCTNWSLAAVLHGGD